MNKKAVQINDIILQNIKRILEESARETIRYIQKDYPDVSGGTIARTVWYWTNRILMERSNDINMHITIGDEPVYWQTEILDQVENAIELQAFPPIEEEQEWRTSSKKEAKFDWS